MRRRTGARTRISVRWTGRADPPVSPTLEVRGLQAAPSRSPGKGPRHACGSLVRPDRPGPIHGLCIKTGADPIDAIECRFRAMEAASRSRVKAPSASMDPVMGVAIPDLPITRRARSPIPAASLRRRLARRVASASRARAPRRAGAGRADPGGGSRGRTPFR